MEVNIYSSWPLNSFKWSFFYLLFSIYQHCTHKTSRLDFNFFKPNVNYYTTCKNLKKSSGSIQERCTDWSITSQKTLHDKNKKMLYHDHAVVRLRNIPVFYTPYFSHPDPSVKRMSGFLPPSTKNFTDLGRTIKTPYFWVIDPNRDLTFTPIFYLDENKTSTQFMLGKGKLGFKMAFHFSSEIIS